MIGCERTFEILILATKQRKISQLQTKRNHFLVQIKKLYELASKFDISLIFVDF